MIKITTQVYLFFKKTFKARMQKLVFAKYEENVYVGYDCVFTHKNIFLENI